MKPVLFPRRTIISVLTLIFALVFSFHHGFASPGDTLVRSLRIAPLSQLQPVSSPAAKPGAVDPRIEELGEALRAVRSGKGQLTGAPAPARSKRDAVAAQLRVSLPEETRIHYRPFAGTPRQIKVKPEARRKGKVLGQAMRGPVSGRERDEKTAGAFLESKRGLLRLTSPGEEMRLFRYREDNLGRRHLRYAQAYRGLPVWPAEMNIHLNENGDIDLVNGAYVPTPQRVVTTPVWSGDQALEQARKAVPDGGMAVAGDPELIVHAPGDRPPRLAWKMELAVSMDADWLVVIDAANGRTLTAYNQVPTQNAAGSGTDLFGVTRPLNLWQDNSQYYMVDTSKPMFNTKSDPSVVNKTYGGITVFDMENNDLPDYGALHAPRAASAFPDSGWVPDAVSLAFCLSETYDYFRERHSRDSIDGKGVSVLGFVRVGQNYNNAFWTSEYNGVFFGDASPYAGALDVVAHEYTHGVTAYTCNLVYRDQPGALNEAFSDIFGEMVEARTTGDTDWRNGTAVGLKRSLSDPAAQVVLSGYRYPDRMSDFYSRSHPLIQQLKDQDYGGVHINMTIITHCFYLLAEGMEGAIGMRDAERIFHRAQSIHLVSNSQFIDARLACISAAEELFGPGSIQALRTAEAFDAVEIYENAATPEPPPAAPVNGADAAVFVSRDPGSGLSYLARFESGLGDVEPGVWLSSSAVLKSRPSVSGDGDLAFFVNSINDACFIDTGGTEREVPLGFAGQIHSVAMSPDESVFGLVLRDGAGKAENSITVLDMRPGGETRTFPLVAPATEGVTFNTVEFADAMDFTSDNRYLVYDAYNVLEFQDGTRIGAWSIYAIDLVTEQTLSLVGPFPDADVGFPAMSQTTNHHMAFDLNETETGETSVYAANLISGDFKIIGTVDGAYTAPGYTGDDGAIVYAHPDPGVPTGFSLVRQPLADDRISPAGGPTSYLPDAEFGVIYRRGAFAGTTPDISLSTDELAFGAVGIGLTVSLPITISNLGTGDLMIGDISFVGETHAEYQLNGGCVGQKLSPSATCRFFVDFRSGSLGEKPATLLVNSDDPDASTMSVRITGTGVDPSFQPAVKSGGGGGGGCFIGSAGEAFFPE